MKVFLSHCSRDKPLLREVQHFLPKFLNLWIDEIEIPYGANLSFSIKSAIQIKSDLLIIFLATEAVESEWVIKELNWALEREKIEKRIFILPVLLNRDCWKKLPQNFQQRKYLLCDDFSFDGVKSFSQRLYKELFFNFLRNIDFRPDDDYVKCKEKVSEIAIYINDDQVNARKNEVLTIRKINKIVSLIDPYNKFLLLVLYELTLGEYSKTITSKRLDRIGMFSVEFSVPKFGIWIHKLDWADKNTLLRELTFDYRLGDNEFNVRDVFLNKIKGLNEKSRNKIFSGMSIIRILQV